VSERTQAMRTIIAKSWKLLVGLAVVAIIVRLVLVDGGPTHVKGAIERYSSIEFRAGSGEDAVLREHGIDPESDAVSTIREEREVPKDAKLGDAPATFGISPTCGCQAASANNWRGVTFAAPDITLNRVGRSPYTEWLLEPSEPGLIKMDNEKKRVFPVDIYRYRDGEPFDETRHHVRELAVMRLPIVSSTPAAVYSNAKVPIGAWIPFPGSDVTLHTKTDPELRNPEVVLDERYPDSVGTSMLTGKGSIVGYLQGYPLGEFLMPSAMVFIGGETEIPNMLAPARGDEVTMIVPHESYGFRVASIPLDSTERDLLRKRSASEDPLITPFGDLVGHNAWLGKGDGGHVTVSIQNTLTGDDYERARSIVASAPQQQFDVSLLPDTGFAIPTAGPNKIRGISEFDRAEQKFEYPPMPPSAGINVFGKMRRLRLNDAVGALSVGGHDIALPTASDVEITRISQLGTVAGHELVPFLTSPTSTETLFDFSGVAEVTIDGKSQTSFFRRNKTLFNGAVLFIGLLASIAGLLQFQMSSRRDGRGLQR
jgi:hypothetical protein